MDESFTTRTYVPLTFFGTRVPKAGFGTLEKFLEDCHSNNVESNFYSYQVGVRSSSSSMAVTKPSIKVRNSLLAPPHYQRRDTKKVPKTLPIIGSDLYCEVSHQLR